MKRAKLLSFGLIASFITAIGVASTTTALWSPNFQSSDDTVTVAKDTTHKGSLYAAGNNVTIDGTVTGSVYCGGNIITINGTVEGDVLCGGQKVTINGTVVGDVRVAGQFIQLSGKIGGSLTAFAQDVRLDQNTSVGGDINGAAQQFTINGMVGRDVAVGTQLLVLDGEIKGNVDVATEQIQLGSRASVLGNFNYGAGKEISFDRSLVHGEVSFNPAQPDDYNRAGHQFVAAARVSLLLMLAVSAIVMILIAPRFIDRSSELFRRQALMTILLGFAIVFGGPILVGLLLFSLVLAPLGLALLFGWLAIIFLSGIFFAYMIGAELLRSQSNVIVRMLGGVAILTIAYMIPVVSAIVLFVSLIVGSGMIAMTFTHGYRRPRYNLRAAAKGHTAKKAAN